MNGNAAAPTHQQSLLQPTTHITNSTAGDANHPGTGTTTSKSQSEQSEDSTAPATQSPPTNSPTHESNTVISQSGQSGSGGDAGPNEQVAAQDKEQQVEAGSSQQQGADGIKEEGEIALEPVNGQIELVEHSPDTTAGAGDTLGAAGDDGHDWLSDGDHELKRVKVCAHHFLAVSCIAIAALCLVCWEDAR